MEIKNSIQRIVFFRNKANISASALSLEIDKNPAYCTKMKAGEFELSMQVVLDIISAWDTTSEEVFYENVNSYKIDKENLKIIKNLNENKKISLKELLKKDKAQ